MQAPIGAEALNRTFQIAYEPTGQAGTGFFIDVDGREYLVTAKHLAHSFTGHDTLLFWHDSNWLPVEARLVGHSREGIDISVFAFANRFVDPSLTLPPSGAGLAFTQSMNFLGFPYGWRNDIGQMNGKFPSPFVKHAILCGAEDADDTLSILLLDGHNNKGFSGGPVVFRDLSTGELKVAGVTSAYRSEEVPIKGAVPGQEQYVGVNAGFVVAYGIEYAVRLARADGNGAL